MSNHDFLQEVALKAIQSASSSIRDYDKATYKILKKGARDYVTNLDYHLEDKIRAYLRKYTPQISILGEERGGKLCLNKQQWVIDPIDGTINLIRDIPLWGIGITLLEKQQPIIGVVRFPLLNETFVSIIGKGCYLNNNRIIVSKVDSPTNAIVGFGDFAGCKSELEMSDFSFKLHRLLAEKCLRVRSVGSALAQLAWLSAGRIDISITLSNKAWDVQAGAIMVREAGGVLFDLEGNEFNISSKCCIATNPTLKDYVLESIKVCKGMS